MKVIYQSENSGGSWWLEDSDWIALEKAGWIVDWAKEGERFVYPDEDGVPRYMGCLAWSAFREGLSLFDAIEEWEKITGQDAYESGCECCGDPHYFCVEE